MEKGRPQAWSPGMPPEVGHIVLITGVHFQREPPASGATPGAVYVAQTGGMCKSLWGFALDQLDTHPVGACQIGNASTRNKFIGLNRKLAAFFPDGIAEIDQVTDDLKTKMVRAPLVVTHKVRKRLQGVLIPWLLSGSLPADQERRALKLHRNLGSAPYLSAASDRAP